MLLPVPRRFVQTSFHRRLRDIKGRFGWHHVVGSIYIAVSGGGALLVNIFALPAELKIWGWGVLGLLLLLALLSASLTWRAKGGEENKCRAALWTCLVHLHKEVFNDSNTVRFTIFTRDPVAKVSVANQQSSKRREEILVPILRRQSGQSDHTNFPSMIYYPVSSRAVTTIAWNECISASGSLEKQEFNTFIYRFPRRFDNKEELIGYYVHVLGIDREIVDRISDYMVDVVQIFSFPLVRHDGVPLALLSVDSKEYFEVGGERNDQRSEQPTPIDETKLATYLELIRSMVIDLAFPSMK